MSDKPSKEDEELSKIDALIAQHSEVFEGVPQLRYSRAVKYGVDQASASKGPAVPHGGYRCHRCGEGGHFIQDCPQGEDGKGGKVRQARGIPRAFLETISEADAAKAGGAFVSAEGGLVVMKSASKEERLRLVGPSVDVELQRAFGKSWEEVKKSISCFLCGEVAKIPTSTSCCGELFCRDCILRHLDRTVVAIDDDSLECPNCDRKDISSADLVPDTSVSSILSRLSGDKASTSTTRSLTAMAGAKLGQPQSKRAKVLKEQLDVEMGDIVTDSAEEDMPIVKRHPNTVLVPGGRKNPFFQSGAPLLAEAEFSKWQEAFKVTLIRTGLLRS